jgi:hypothetical protein
VGAHLPGWLQVGLAGHSSLGPMRCVRRYVLVSVQVGHTVDREVLVNILFYWVKLPRKHLAGATRRSLTLDLQGWFTAHGTTESEKSCV